MKQREWNEKYQSFVTLLLRLFISFLQGGGGGGGEKWSNEENNNKRKPVRKLSDDVTANRSSIFFLFFIYYFFACACLFFFSFFQFLSIYLSIFLLLFYFGFWFGFPAHIFAGFALFILTQFRDAEWRPHAHFSSHKSRRRITGQFGTRNARRVTTVIADNWEINPISREMKKKKIYIH